MCHDPSSRPPAPPRVGAVAESRRLTLEADDGAALSAALALPVSAPRAAFVVLPDVRGLHAYYIALCDRLAEAGFAAVAIDYFGRTAGLVDAAGRGADFDYVPQIALTAPESIDADTAAAIAFLRTVTEPALPILTIGFCFGGSNAWRQAAGDLELAGCVGFYGQPKRVGEAADHVVKPTLMLIAGDDRAASVDQQLELADRMRANGADVRTVVFDGAPHSFFDRSYGDHADDCDRAWREIIEFAEPRASRLYE